MPRKIALPKRKKRAPAVSRAGRNPPTSPSRLVPVAGIGASAGGLEAFRLFLEALPNNTGMAFVLVSHLNKAHGSMLAEILSKATTMPVAEVQDRAPVLANHIYVIPPNAILEITKGRLSARPLREARRPVMVIDTFFRSLAEHSKSQAIGVVLSGTGTDGTLGLAAIKAEGGIAFAQDQQSAKYPDMPRSASAHFGSADFVLPPAQIAREIARIAGHPSVRQTKKEPESESTSGVPYSTIFDLLRSATGVDFSGYKPTTIRRRISRRMVLKKIESLTAYQKRLASDPLELEALCQDLLITVSAFFRDAETFEFLQTVIIPEIVKEKPGDMAIRVWVPGCATGEEAYSIAMLLLESTLTAEAVVQIFATDVNKPAIQAAREGYYREANMAGISPERLRRFFVKSNGGYQVGKQVRDLCVFAVQNVIKDPPFSKTDLISCRNLLIYLGTPLKEKVLNTFHYALNPNGRLLLGASEAVGSGSGLFRQVDKKHKVYSKLMTSVRPHFELGVADQASAVARRLAAHQRNPIGVSQEADRIVLTRYSPPGVLVNSAFNIVQFRGHTGAFLEPPPGSATLNLLKMSRTGLMMDLRTALQQAKKAGAPVRRSGVRVRVNGGLKKLDLEVTPILDNSSKEPYYLVLFHAAEQAKEPPQAPRTLPPGRKKKASVHQPEIVSLRAELAAIQADLRTIIEEQEGTTEELQSANEEILSSNEELQSTNEELETAKEELQATNEELTTVNDELQARIAELAEAHSDLTNLIDSVDAVYVMLGNDLRIRRFTPAAQKVLNLIPTDVGRPLGDIKPKIQVPDLPEMIAEVIANMGNKELDVQDSDGRWYAMKIRPYKTQEDKIDGAVMALTDVDALRLSRRVSSDLDVVLRSLLEHPPDLLLSVSPEGHVSLANSSGLGAASGDQSIFGYLEPQDREAMRQCLRQALKTGAAAEVEVHRFALRPRTGVVIAVQPITGNEGILAFSIRVKDAPPGRLKGA
jgi:two-component system, chemotaxis family, CheB/CheR fusion protein